MMITLPKISTYEESSFEGYSHIRIYATLRQDQMFQQSVLSPKYIQCALTKTTAFN